MQTTVHESFPPAEALMREVLRAGEPIAPEYPLVFQQGLPGRVVTVEEQVAGEPQLRSACAILTRELILPGVRLRVGFIGSVVTHPEHRRQGWGARALARAEEALRADGCALSMLWADNAGYYEGQGYRPVGVELDYLVDPCLSAILPSMQRVRVARDEDLPRLFELYASKDVRVERSAAEMSALLAIPGMELLVRESEAGEVVAYSCVGRGADFGSVVHEWAGIGEDVLAILQAHVQHRLEVGDRDPLVMMVPVEDNVRNFFDLIEAPHISGLLGMGKLLDPRPALAAVRGLLPGSVEFEIDAQNATTFRSPGGELTLSDSDLLTALIEPKGTRKRITQLEEALDVSLPGLPLKPFVWGLDSI